LDEQNVILTHAGELVPFFGEDTLRRKNKASVTFHKNGMIKSVALEEQQDVTTPIGGLPAELITFYDTGEVHRVFPLDGKISGFWSEEDERGLNIPLTFDFGFTSFTALISGICFYKSGAIKSITLFPGEQIEVTHTHYGPIKVRHGFSLYETGALESLEPTELLSLETPIGLLTAYNVNAHGINADSCSLCFDLQGRVIRLAASGGTILVSRRSDGALFSFTAKVIDPEDDGLQVTLPVGLAFDHTNRTVVITGGDGSSARFLFDDHFFVYSTKFPITGCSASDCARCSKCSF
jgi:hypothetical protein